MAGLTTAGTMPAPLHEAIARNEAAFARIVAAYHAHSLRLRVQRLAVLLEP